MKKDKTLHVGDSVRLSKRSQFYKPNRSQKANNGTVATIQGNTIMVKMGTGSHKVMTIKDVVKNPSKVKAPKVPPLSVFESWDIKRWNGGTTIAFGCGEVQVTKQDLLDAAELLEKPNASNNLVRLRNSNLSDQQIFDLAELIKEPSFIKGRRAVQNLSSAAGSRRSFQQIANIPATTLRRIAG